MQNSAAFIDSAKVMAKGQVTIPADVRKALGVAEGDRVSFVFDGESVRIVNAAIFAMQVLQAQLEGESEKSGLVSDDDIMALVKDIRKEGKHE